MMHRRTVLAALGTLAAIRRDRLVSAQSTPEIDPGWAHPEWFTWPVWLHQYYQNPGRRIVALTSPEEFTAGHIPGATQLDWSDLSLVDSADATVAAWQDSVCLLLAERGITPESSVDIYDGGTFYAARLWWVLDVLGHRSKYLIDGGFPAWAESGGPVEMRPPRGLLDSPPYESSLNLDSLAAIAIVEEAVDLKSAVLVDARDPDEYAQGHIPGAVNVPFLENAEPNSQGVWKQPSDLIEMYGTLGITPDRAVIPYCSTGVRSANTWFTLKALGYPDVKLFSGSFAEWTSDPTRPIE